MDEGPSPARPQPSDDSRLDPSGRHATNAPLFAGTLIGGKYVVVRVLGRGGMGIVYEARHMDLDERVAIKVLHEKYADNPEALARFQHEARAAARIRGEHSARLADVGTTDAGAPFFVMELLEGNDLAQILKAGPIAYEEATFYVLQACVGMAEVHAHGIVHRDLKPGNLFLTRRTDGTPLVKVLDFGIAKSALPLDAAERAVTMTLVALGTPLYMAPEQIRSSKDVDSRADVWSLGAILYELIAGKPAFGGNSVAHITAQVLELDPPPLAPRGTPIPHALDVAIRRALAKKRDARWVDMAALAAAIAPFAGPEGPAYAARAARILRGEGRGAGATPFGVSGQYAIADPSSETQMQTEVQSKHSILPKRRRGLVRVGSVAAVIVFGVAASIVNVMVSNGPKIETPAMRGIAAACAVRAAVAITAARLAADHAQAQDAAPSPAISASAEPRAPATNAAPPRAGKRGKPASEDDVLGARK